MPISFRCSSCEHLLSTARRKAGSSVICPRCNTWVSVPQPGEVNTTSTASTPELALGAVPALEGPPVAAFATMSVASLETALGDELSAPRRKRGMATVVTAVIVLAGLLTGYVLSQPAGVNPEQVSLTRPVLSAPHVVPVALASDWAPRPPRDEQPPPSSKVVKESVRK